MRVVRDPKDAIVRNHKMTKYCQDHKSVAGQGHLTGAPMAQSNIDTVDALMAHYVAGSLPEPARVLVASHLLMRPERRAFVDDLEMLAGNALERMPAVEVEQRNSRLSEIFRSFPPSQTNVPDRQTIFPAPLRHLIGFDGDAVPWRTKLPGFKEYTTDIDGCEVSLMWIRPGRAVPAHTHKGFELTLVLDGAYNDESGRYGPGDISVADGELNHRPIAEKDGPCIAFAVLDAPIKLTGRFSQRISDIIG